MEQSLEQRIRERAYEIWSADGKAAGKATEHWLMAERELLASVADCSARPEAGRRRKPRSSTGREQRHRKAS